MKATIIAVIAILGTFLAYCAFKVFTDPQATWIHFAGVGTIIIGFIAVVLWELRPEETTLRDGIPLKECHRHSKAGGYRAVMGPAGTYRCPVCGRVWTKEFWL